MSTNLKNILVWLAVVVSLVLLWQLFYNIRDVNVEEKNFTSFYQEMTAKKIKDAKITGGELEAVDQTGKKFKTVIPPEATWDLIKQLQDNGVRVTIEKSSTSSMMYVFLSAWMPFIGTIIGYVIFYALPIALIIWIVVRLRRMEKRIEQIERLLLNRS